MKMVEVHCFSCSGKFSLAGSDDLRMKLTGSSWYCPHCGRQQEYKREVCERAVNKALATLISYDGLCQQMAVLQMKNDQLRLSRNSLRGVITKLRRRLDDCIAAPMLENGTGGA